MRDLVVIGAGGLTREVLELVRADPDDARRWRPVAVLDDDPRRHGTVVGGVPCVGGREALRDYDDAQVVVCTGRPGDSTSRPRIVGELGLPPERYATLVHRAAELAPSVTVGPGSVVLAGSVGTADVLVGAHVVVMPQVVLTHDDVLADFVTCASGVRLGGGVRVGEGAYLGAGCTVREGTTVGAWSLVGMGSVVLRDVPDGEVWAGNPAHPLRTTGISDGPAGGTRRR